MPIEAQQRQTQLRQHLVHVLLDNRGRRRDHVGVVQCRRGQVGGWKRGMVGLNVV